MGFAVRSLDAAMAPDWGDVVPVHSSLDGPIESLSILRRSLLFAELSKFATCRGPRPGGWLSHRLSGNSLLRPRRRQAYIFANDDDAVVTCRGTEPNDWNDIKADLDLATVMAETAGWVHRGFKREVDDLWPRLEQALVNNTRHAVVRGHSLGGAMAAICAGRCKLSYIRSNPRALYTFGSPRVGNALRELRAARSLPLGEQQRHRDPRAAVVARLSPQGAGSLPQRLRQNPPADRLAARERPLARLRRGLASGEFDHFADHSITRYVEHIRGRSKRKRRSTRRCCRSSGRSLPARASRCGERRRRSCRVTAATPSSSCP